MQEQVSPPLLARTPIFWSTAAAFGALWGTIEITLGSFLHSVKLPFTGAILASVGTALLVAQRQVIHRRGLSVATAVIAALCKSLSPGGAILGPMLGITVEGLLVEVVLLAAPRFVGSALIAGMLAAIWAVFQKLIVHFFLFGSTILEIYQAILKKAGEWLGHSHAGWWLATALMGIIAIIGVMGALFGWLVGRDAARSLERSP